MKITILSLMMLGSLAQAHPENPGCKAIHDACTGAKQTGKAGWKCAHSIMKGEKVDGVAQDLSAQATECKQAMAKHRKGEGAASESGAATDKD